MDALLFLELSSCSAYFPKYCIFSKFVKHLIFSLWRPSSCVLMQVIPRLHLPCLLSYFITLMTTLYQIQYFSNTFSFFSRLKINKTLHLKQNIQKHLYDAYKAEKIILHTVAYCKLYNYLARYVTNSRDVTNGMIAHSLGSGRTRVL